MLNDFTWNMTGYIPKHQVNPHGDGIIPYVIAGKEFDIFLILPTPLRTAAQQAHQRLSRCGRR